MNNEQSNSPRKRRTKPREPTIRYTVQLPEELGSWAKSLPGGLSKVLTRLLQREQREYEQRFNEILERELALVKARQEARELEAARIVAEETLLKTSSHVGRPRKGIKAKETNNE